LKHEFREGVAYYPGRPRYCERCASAPEEDDKMSKETLGDMLVQLEQAKSEPVRMLALLSAHKSESTKFVRGLERTQREVVVVAYAVHVKAKAAGTLETLVAAIREQDKSIKFKCAYLAILHSFVDYGAGGGQYASRDKAVCEYLESQTIAVDKASEFIKANKGLHNCYALRRKDTRRIKGLTDKEDAKKPTRTIAGLYPDYIQHDGDMAVVLLQLKNAEKGLLEFIQVIQVDAIPTGAKRTEFQSEFTKEMDRLAERYRVARTLI
jgi:hypothetical protein